MARRLGPCQRAEERLQRAHASPQLLCAMDSRERSRRLADPGFGWMAGDSLAPARRLRARRAAAGERRFLQPGEPRSGPPSERWRLMVRGRVQGVGYRAGCHRRANELGLSGWVRNLPDGSVEVEAEGAPQHLAELVLWCEKGPLRAQVNGVGSTRVAVTGDDWFEIRG
jgi:acylphosphatase